jgi:hypothetical protein
MNNCIICESAKKSYRYWLCKPCAVEWGCYKTPFRDWPEWVKALHNMEQKRRRREQKLEEIPLEPNHVIMLIDNMESRP